MVYTSYLTISCSSLNYTQDIILEDNFLLGVLMMDQGYKWSRNGPVFINRKTIDKFINKEIGWLRAEDMNQRTNPKYHWLLTQLENQLDSEDRPDHPMLPQVKEYSLILKMIVGLRNHALHPGYVKLTYHHQFSEM